MNLPLPRKATAARTDPDMTCPSCNVNLVVSERQGVEIDTCPQCRGVWLERGEVEKIIDRSRPEFGVPSQQTYRPDRSIYSDSFDGRRYRKKRRKSFFEELFD